MPDEADEGDSTCPGCGLAQSAWSENQGQGYVSQAGELYCCQVCATGGKCDCAYMNEDQLTEKGA